MSDFQEPIHQTTAETPRWVGLAVALLGGVSLVGVGLGWSAINKTQGIEAETAASVKASNDAIQQRLAKEEEINQQLVSDLKVVTDKLNLTQTQLVSARKANKLNGDVSGVRTDLDATNNSIQMARSEMGTLIARNHDEIDQLRRMGQRDYYEFTVTRKNGAERVGSIMVELKDTNTKKNQYTINVLADDKSFEKKNRSVNEPIFFYTGGSKAALELVVNKVSKTTASGYLSVPKSAGTASASASGTAQ